MEICLPQKKIFIKKRKQQKIQIIFGLFILSYIVKVDIPIIYYWRLVKLFLDLSPIKNYSTMQANPNSKLTRQFLKNLYETKCANSSITPILQILAFQQSFHEPHSEIIVRLSDGVVFIDCSLVGPYCIKDNKIVSIDSGQSQIQFNQKDLVKLTDYFSKIDNRRICQLRVMIIKMQLNQRMTSRIGYPSELRQYFQNMKEQTKQKNQQLPPQVQPQPQINQIRKQISNENSNKKSAPEFIKIQDDLHQTIADQSNKKFKIENSQNKNGNNIKFQQGQRANSISDIQQPLTYNEIISGKDGYFLGRLLRVKMANKQTKEGPMSVLYLGFVDREGELVRVNMAGRLAMKQERELKKGKCYYIKDLEVYQTEKMSHPQIRLKDKQYRIVQVQQPSITERFTRSYYHWDHENQIIESDNVDIIGIIDEIQQKAIYPHSNQKRQVVRIIVRNKFKTVKINFWAEQIKILSSLKLKKKQAIVLEDIKKKKNIFLDYQYQSSVIKLDENPALKQELKDLLPNSLDTSQQPKNIRQLSQIYQTQTSSNKLLSFRVFLSRMQQNRIIYKLCSYCRRKVQKFLQTCSECNGNQFYYKYNCQLQFADYSGSLNCVAFQFSAQRMLNKSPAQINQLNSEDLSKLIQDHLFKQYQISFQNRSCRFIVRNVQVMENSKQYTKSCRDNLLQIYKLLRRSKQDKNG